jgi:hypothetical protein
MTSRRSFLATSLGAAGALLGLPGAGWPAQRREPTLGLNVQPPITATTVRQLAELRVRHVRLSAWWAWYEAPKWASQNALLRAAGVEVLPLLTSPPARLNRAAPAELQSAVAAFAKSFLQAQGPLPYLQVGNEWDSGSPWFGPESGLSKRVRGRRYGELLRAVAPVVRGAGSRVVTMGMGAPDAEFIRGMLETGAASIDAIALHIYADHIWGEPWGRYRVCDEAGWAGAIWVTEFGMKGDFTRDIWRRAGKRPPSRQEVEQYQIDNWRIPLTEDESRFRYQRVYGFQLPSDGQEDGFGLVRPNGTPRPVYRWLQTR